MEKFLSSDQSTLSPLELLDLDPALDRAARAACVLKKLPDPRRFRVGALAVALEFTPGGPGLEETFTELLLRLKSGLEP